MADSDPEVKPAAEVPEIPDNAVNTAVSKPVIPTVPPLAKREWNTSVRLVCPVCGLEVCSHSPPLAKVYQGA